LKDARPGDAPLGVRGVGAAPAGPVTQPQAKATAAGLVVAEPAFNDIRRLMATAGARTAYPPRAR